MSYIPLKRTQCFKTEKKYVTFTPRIHSIYNQTVAFVFTIHYESKFLKKIALLNSLTRFVRLSVCTLFFMLFMLLKVLLDDC
jgi:hypothetical protein